MLPFITQAAIRLAEDGSGVTELDINPDDVTPGVLGFVITLLFALAVIGIGLDLYRRVRRMQYRQEVLEEIEAELADPDADTNPSIDTDPRA